MRILFFQLKSNTQTPYKQKTPRCVTTPLCFVAWIKSTLQIYSGNISASSTSLAFNQMLINVIRDVNHQTGNGSMKSVT